MADAIKQLQNLQEAMVDDIMSMTDDEILEEQREDDLLSEWLLMIYGYTCPHWTARLERQTETRAWLDGIIAERFGEQR